MTDIVATLLNYGALGAFAAFCLIVMWRGGRAFWVFFFAKDDDPANQGYVTRRLETALAREIKQNEFIDVMIETERQRNTLCEKHHDDLVQIAGVLTVHSGVAEATHQDVRNLRTAAMEACQMTRGIAARVCQRDVANEVDGHCKQIEQILQYGNYSEIRNG